MFSHCFLDFSVGVGAFVIGWIQISSFFTYSLKLIRIELMSFVELSNFRFVCLTDKTNSHVQMKSIMAFT